MPRLQADFQSLLTDLHKQVEEHAEAAKAARETAAQFEKRKADLEAQAVRNEQKRRREWADKSDSLVADFEARAQMMMAQVVESAEQRKAAEQAQRLVSKTKREFREEASQVMASVLPEAKLPASLPIEEGARVKLRDIREAATVRRLLKNGMLEVEAGFLKMQVSRDDVVEVLPAAEQNRKPKNVNIDVGPRWDISYRELNLIGQRADDAVEQVDKFLDSAALASVDRVRIIHGHGMGILKKAVSDLLSKNPHVSRYYPATQSEGGTGATIVELRD
jgi:DNA mismatch repair protein MutS2